MMHDQIAVKVWLAESDLAGSGVQLQLIRDQLN